MSTVRAMTGGKILPYLASIAVALVIILYFQSVYSPAQPTVLMRFNYSQQTGYGYIINTLPYAINVSSIYCKTSSGTKEEFNTKLDHSLQPGSNTFMTVSVDNSMETLPQSCGGWGVLYTKGILNTTPNNSPVYVQTGSNTFKIENGTT